MDQSGLGSRFRRVLPFALAGVGIYAVVAYGTSMFSSAPTHLVAQRVAPADQMIASGDPLPAAAPVQLPGQAPVTSAVGQLGQVGQVGGDMLPGDAAAVTRNLNNSAASAVVPSSASTSGASTPAVGAIAGAAAAQPNGLLGGLPVVGSLPVAGAVNNLPLQNITGSGVLPTNPTSALKNIAGVGGVQLPQVNGQSLGGGLIP